MTALVVGLALVVLVQAVLVAGLIRSHAELRRSVLALTRPEPSADLPPDR